MADTSDGTVKVLVVDDDPMMRRLTQRFLEPMGLSVDTADSGQAALDLVEQHTYGMIFMDNMMPIMDGMLAAYLIRQMDGAYYRNVPIIALTGSDSEEERAIFLRSGFQAVLTKPPKKELLKNVVETWLWKHPSKNEADIPADTAGEAVPEGADDPDLPQIRGIDPAEGIKHCGGKDSYLEFLENFHQTAQLRCQKIVDDFNRRDIRDYTVEAHDLKNQARMIGAAELSERFRKLEEFGKAQDIAQIKKNLPPALKACLRIRKALTPYVQHEEEFKKLASAKKLTIFLNDIRSAAQVSDLDAVDTLVKALEAYRLPERCQEPMQRMLVYAQDFALEDVIAEADAMITILEDF